MKKIIITSFFLLACTLSNLQAQDYSLEAKQYFEQYHGNADISALVMRSLPTLADCKRIFVGDAAETYFQFLDEMKTAMQTESVRAPETFVDIRIEAFSTQDIVLAKGNYAGGMASIASKLQPYVVFYEVNYLREKGATFGVAHKFWVYLNGKWLMFPKPWRAFE